MVRAVWNGVVVAESDETVVVEGNHYFPREAVRHEFLVPSSTTTVCGWKGTAAYYSVAVNGKVNRDAAWCYPSPAPGAEHIAGRIAFWQGVRIDDAAVRRRGLLEGFHRSDRRSAAPVAATGRAGRGSAGTPVVEADDTSFFAVLDGHVAIADFGASWCRPCRVLEPNFDELAARHASPELRFVRVDIERSPGLVSLYQVRSIPTLISFDQHGNEFDRPLGVPKRRRLEELVSRANEVARHTTA